MHKVLPHSDEGEREHKSSVGMWLQSEGCEVNNGPVGTWSQMLVSPAVSLSTLVCTELHTHTCMQASNNRVT